VQKLIYQRPGLSHFDRTISDATRAYLDEITRSRSKNTSRTYKASLTILAALATGKEDASPVDVDWTQFAGSRFSELQERLVEEGLSAQTVNVRLTALRGVLKQARDWGLISRESYDYVVSLKTLAPGIPDEAPPATIEEVQALFLDCYEDDHPVRGTRDAGVIICAYAAGMIASEIIGSDLDDYDRENRTIEAEYRGSHRRMLLAPAAAQGLDDWVSVRGDEPGPLFPVLASNAPGQQKRRMVDTSIRQMLHQRCENAGTRYLTIGDLRRAYNNHLEEAVRRAQRQMHVPYIRNERLAEAEA
jgi:integrase